MSEITEGTTVRLKSGGVVMTVQDIDGDYAECVWQDGAKHMTQTYKLSVLELVDLKAQAAAFKSAIVRRS